MATLPRLHMRYGICHFIGCCLLFTAISKNIYIRSLTAVVCQGYQ